jgi:hypothetical protein
MVSKANSIADMRERARKCRQSAAEYKSEIGALLEELALELDRKADGLDAELARQV